MVEERINQHFKRTTGRLKSNLTGLPKVLGKIEEFLSWTLAIEEVVMMQGLFWLNLIQLCNI